MTLTNAQRQARHRARQAQAAAQAGTDTGTILATLDTLTRAVQALASEVHALGTGGGYVRQNGAKPGSSVTSRGQNRDVTARPPARARDDGGLPPTGVGRPPDDVTADDAHTVLVALTRPGSVGSIRDALGAIGRDLALDRITAALVTLQGQGLVARRPGEGPAPDVWEALEDPVPEDLQGARPVQEAGPPAHVECSAYSAHSTLGHRWDPLRGAFRCYVCDPEGRPDHGPLGNPTPRGATLQEVH